MSDPGATTAAEQANLTSATGPRPDPGLFPVTRSWKVAAVAAIIMVLLALAGVAITTSSPSAASGYWIALVPLYGVICVSIAWSRARHAGTFERTQVLRQIWHWLGIGVALALDFVIRGTGAESNAAAGENAVLLLALGCYLAGVHLEWFFVIVGGLLTLALIVLTKADQYLWLIFVVGGLSIVALFGFQRLLGGQHARKASVASSAH